MNEKSAIGIDLTDEHPPEICATCAASGTEYVPSGAVFVYCICSGKGAMREHGEDWMVMEGLTQSQFTREVYAAVLKAEVISAEMVMAKIARDGDTAH